MALIDDLIKRSKGLLGVGGPPEAYSRITRTPIHIGSPGPNMSGEYANGQITARPDVIGSGGIVPHESAHQIYERANLRSGAADLAAQVPEGPKNFILASHLYQNMGDYSGSAEQISDEGLGRSIGDPDGTPYVNYVASKIQDPTLRAQLLRLHQNALGSHNAVVRGIGGTQ